MSNAPTSLRLTAAQARCLAEIDRRGFVQPYGASFKTIGKLQALGLVHRGPTGELKWNGFEEYGYMLTPAGQAEADRRYIEG